MPPLLRAIRAVIQPGGSMRAGEVIAARRETTWRWCLRAIRHFRH